MLKLLVLVMKWHGIDEGELMHTKCLLCLLCRVINGRRLGVKLYGFWQLPKFYRVQVKL